MMHVIKQTRDEKIAMYMKLTKRELAEMLVNSNEAISLIPRRDRWVTDIAWPRPGSSADLSFTATSPIAAA